MNNRKISYIIILVAAIASALYASRLLGDMEDEVLPDLASEIALHLLSGGQAVVEQGDESDSLYTVISGRLRVVHGYGTDWETTLYEMGRGQTVGEMGFLTTANITSSRLMIHERGPIWKYLRGTASVPGVFPPVMENGEMLVDGGLINNLPTDVMSQRSDIGTTIALDVGGSAAGTFAAWEENEKFQALKELARPE